MSVSRRSFMAGLLAAVAAPALPPIPAARETSYLMFEAISLEKFGNYTYAVYWNRALTQHEIASLAGLWVDQRRVY